MNTIMDTKKVVKKTVTTKKAPKNTLDKETTEKPIEVPNPVVQPLKRSSKDYLRSYYHPTTGSRFEVLYGCEM